MARQFHSQAEFLKIGLLIDLYEDVHSNFVYSSKTLETSQMSMNWKINEYIEVYLFNRILLSIVNKVQMYYDEARLQTVHPLLLYYVKF